MTDMPPIIAILRGITAEEIIPVAEVLVNAGIGAIEIPLNSPDPLTSIRKLVESYGETILCGAGTVLDVAQVAAVAATNARLIVSPDSNPAVIAATRDAGMLSFPGCHTPTEAFSALRAGATGLKLYPASTGGIEHMRALRDVLPASTPLYAVGGVSADNAAIWRQAGATGLGVGGGIYKPGREITDIMARAKAIVAAWG